MAKKATVFEFKEPVTRPSMPITPDTAVPPPIVQEPPTVVSRPRTQTTVTAVPRQPSARPSVQQALVNIAAEFRAAKTAVVISFATGVTFGLVVLGWWLVPVEWVNAPLSTLAPNHKAVVVEAAADLAAYDLLSARVASLAYQWPGMDAEACNLAATETDPAQQARLISLAYRVNGVGCGATNQP